MLRPRDRRNDLLLVETDAPPALLRAAIVEDVFALIADRTFDSPPHVRDIAALLARPAFERALALHHAMRPKRRSRSYKVVARVRGRQRFRRDEVHDVCERALAALLPHWVPREDATLALWAHAIGNRALVGVRLSDDTVAGRRYKRAHLPASLKPTIARALVLLVGTDAGDVVVDLMCGAGTLLRERADAGPARLVLGGDIDAEVIAAARTNVTRSAQLARWDAKRLPLRPASVDALITNPPYGRQHPAASLRRLYREMAREYARVLRPGGRCVVLASEPAVLREALPQQLATRRRLALVMRGLDVTAVVLSRR